MIDRRRRIYTIGRMDDLITWAGTEIASHALGVASGVVGVAILTAIRKWAGGFWNMTRESLPTGVLIGLTVWLVTWLPMQIDQSFEKHTTAVNQLATALEEHTEKLAAIPYEPMGTPARPYFTLMQAVVSDDGNGTGELSLSVKNNEVPAEDVVSHLLVVSKTLNSGKGPLHSSRSELANPIGGSGSHRHYWSDIRIVPDIDPAFVVLQLQYSHAFSGDKFSQIYFMVFSGSSEDGSYKKNLNNANRDQKVAIVRYLEKRGITFSR